MGEFSAGQFIIGVLIAVGGFIYVLFVIATTKIGEKSDEVFNLQKRKRKSHVSKTTCGSNIRKERNSHSRKHNPK